MELLYLSVQLASERFHRCDNMSFFSARMMLSNISHMAAASSEKLSVCLPTSPASQTARSPHIQFLGTCESHWEPYVNDVCMKGVGLKRNPNFADSDKLREMRTGGSKIRTTTGTSFKHGPFYCVRFSTLPSAFHHVMRLFSDYPFCSSPMSTSIFFFVT